MFGAGCCQGYVSEPTAKQSLSYKLLALMQIGIVSMDGVWESSIYSYLLHKPTSLQISPTGFEPATPSFVGLCSSPLSYGDMKGWDYTFYSATFAGLSAQRPRWGFPSCPLTPGEIWHQDCLVFPVVEAIPLYRQMCSTLWFPWTLRALNGG